MQSGINICHWSDGKVSLVVNTLQVQESVAAFAIANAALVSRGDWNHNNVSEVLEARHVQFIQSWGKTFV